MQRIRMVVLLVVFWVAGLFLTLQMGARGLAAASTTATHKVIAPTGSLDGRSGVTLWHDYGPFALYRVTDSALAGLRLNGPAAVTVADDMDRLLFDAYPFDTQREALKLPQAWSVTAVSGPALHLIQFVGPIKDEWLAAVAATGVVPVHYVANNGYLVWADDNGRAHLQKLAQSGQFLQYSQPYQPYFKLGSSIAERMSTAVAADEIVPVVIQILRHPGQNETESLLKKWLISVQADWQAVDSFQNIIGTVHAADIPAIAARPDVYWIGEQFERELMDEVQGQILAGSFDASQTGPSGPGYLAWLDGLGFSQNPADYPIVDITDDGIGNGTVDSGDPTLHELGSSANPSRLAYVDNCTAAADGGGLDGHGHINVSIAGGYDRRAGWPYRDEDGFQLGLGINPYGRFAGTRVFTDIFDLSACGNSDQALIKRTQDNGAQISSNSWGCGGCASLYDTSSQAYDAGARDADLDEPGNQPLIFIFAAGNNGPGAGTIGTPGNGKNVITVGASENDRPTWIDGCAVGPAGADNIMDVISFSSRGPAPGDRVKPELIAPGTHVQGTASTNAAYDDNGTGICDQYWPSGQTTFAASSGTSHSTPAVAGAASLYYYWLENQYNMITPSPALLKAYFMAHPTYLTGAAANDTLPSNAQGYGMPDMSLAFDGTARYLLDETAVLDHTGQTWHHASAVADPQKPLRIVMAYTDQAGLVGTSPQVNDLNLTVELENEVYWGNNFSGGWSVPGGTADAANNYEAIYLPLGTTGNFTITVTAYNVAGDGLPGNADDTDQDFALVCYNCTEEPDFNLLVTPPAQSICAPDEAVFDVTVKSLLGFSDPVTLYANSVFTTTFATNPVFPTGSSQLVAGNTTIPAAGEYEVIVSAIAPTSTHTTSLPIHLYDRLPDAVTLAAPVNTAVSVPLSPLLTWQSAAQAASYDLEVALDVAFAQTILTATATSNSYLIPFDLAAKTTYYWRVRANNACGAGAFSPVYSFTTLPIVCSSPNLAIPDGDRLGTTDEIVVSETITLADLDVFLDVSHTWVGDLTFSLSHLDTGTTITLVDRPGVPASTYGCYADDMAVILDDEAGVWVEDLCNVTGTAVSGAVRPVNALSSFDNELLSGTWRLTAIDNIPNDAGTLNEWCLRPTSIPDNPAPDRLLFLPLALR